MNEETKPIELVSLDVGINVINGLHFINNDKKDFVISLSKEKRKEGMDFYVVLQAWIKTVLQDPRPQELAKAYGLEFEHI